MSLFIRAVSITFLIFQVGCRQLPVISTADTKDFKVSYRGQVNLVDLQVWSVSRQVMLWEVNLGDSREFNYGETPPDGMQIFPKENKAPLSLIEDEEIVLNLSYRYDSFMAACGSSETKMFRKNKNFTQIPLTRKAGFKPQWKSLKDRKEFEQSILKEIDEGHPRFLLLDGDLNASPAEKRLIQSLKDYVGISDAKSAYIQLRSLDSFCPSPNSLSDIRILSDFVNFKTLLLIGQGIEDISPLSGLKNLEFLRIEDNKIQDVSPLSGLSKLNVLQVDSNNLTNLDAIAKLPALYRLTASKNNINDISGIRNHNILNDIDLADNSVVDVSPLANLPNLYTLELSNNKIVDISPLVTLGNL